MTPTIPIITPNSTVAVPFGTSKNLPDGNRMRLAIRRVFHAFAAAEYFRDKP
jgi:hypothetical protein